MLSQNFLTKQHGPPSCSHVQVPITDFSTLFHHGCFVGCLTENKFRASAFFIFVHIRYKLLQHSGCLSVFCWVCRWMALPRTWLRYKLPKFKAILQSLYSNSMSSLLQNSPPSHPAGNDSSSNQQLLVQTAILIGPRSHHFTHNLSPSTTSHRERITSPYLWMMVFLHSNTSKTCPKMSECMFLNCHSNLQLSSGRTFQDRSS